MKGSTARFTCVVLTLVGLVTLAFVLAGAEGPEAGIALPTDWSHRHLIFSQPATAEQAMRVQQDPRYAQQWYRRNQRLALPAGTPEVDTASSLGLPGASNSPPSSSGQKLRRDWSEDLGSGATVGGGNFPAKFSLTITTASCGTAPQPDYVVHSTGLSGSSTQASIVAYDNLYSGCTAPVPSTYWAYNTAGQILTSPVLSLDGTQVAFVQTNAALTGTLVVLKWAASGTETVGSPGVPATVAASSYPACPAPCMTTLILRTAGNTATDDTTSSIFYDYGTDTAWVGDSQGWLHKFSALFAGVPAEVRGGGWPAHIVLGTPLSSPVHDVASGRVYVGDGGGFLSRVDASSGAITKSGQLDFGTGIVDNPIVDESANVVYVFASSDGTATCVGGTACAAVYQLSGSFTAGATGSKATVGASVVFGGASNPNPLYDGAFDSAYENSVSATGDVYVCGNTGGNPILYQVSILAGVLGTVNAGPVLSSSAASACSPVTDVLNPNAAGSATEWVFASTKASGTPTACAAGGCVMNFKDTPWKASTAYVVGQEVIDTHFQIQVVRTAGTSRNVAPAWSAVKGATTNDNTIRWLNQGPISASYATWIASHAYALGTEIVDSNKNIQLVTTAGPSKAGAHPAWSAVVNATTADNTVRWRNVGAIATTALASSGGTSGIIIDNTVGSGTLAGASQVYFSTRGNQTCVTSGGTGGCAVQASQSALQ